LTNVVALAVRRQTDSIQMQSCLNCVPLIDIKRQKEVLQQILIDVIAFRGVGITGSDGRRFVGGERQGGAGNAELRTIILHCILSSECF
jgi:hypothetical protein